MILGSKGSYWQILVLVWLNFRDWNCLAGFCRFSFSGLLTRRYIGKNYRGEKYCRILSNSSLKWYLRNSGTINFRTPKLSEKWPKTYSICCKVLQLRYLWGSWTKPLLTFYDGDLYHIDRNQFINLLCKSVDWFLYDRDLCHEKVKALTCFPF